MSEHTLTAEALRQFTGTEHWYRHGLIRNVTYTDGAKYVADQAGAYWLLDIIAIAQKFEPKLAGEYFQFWKLTVRENASAVIVCEDGQGHELYRQEISFTDFPLPEFAFYCCRDAMLGQGVDWVILLPSEY
jgi:hypothetical protein